MGVMVQAFGVSASLGLTWRSSLHSHSLFLIIGLLLFTEHAPRFTGPGCRRKGKLNVVQSVWALLGDYSQEHGVMLGK